MVEETRVPGENQRPTVTSKLVADKLYYMLHLYRMVVGFITTYAISAYRH